MNAVDETSRILGALGEAVSGIRDELVEIRAFLAESRNDRKALHVELDATQRRIDLAIAKLQGMRIGAVLALLTLGGAVAAGFHSAAAWIGKVLGVSW